MVLNEPDGDRVRKSIANQRSLPSAGVHFGDAGALLWPMLSFQWETYRPPEAATEQNSFQRNPGAEISYHDAIELLRIGLQNSTETALRKIAGQTGGIDTIEQTNYALTFHNVLKNRRK